MTASVILFALEDDYQIQFALDVTPGGREDIILSGGPAIYPVLEANANWIGGVCI